MNEGNVTQFTTADFLDQCLAVRRMAAHQSGGNLQVFLLRSFAGPQHALQATRVRRKRLLHEHVQTLVHGVVKVDTPEPRMGCQHGNVARLQAIDRLAIRIEADELPIGRHVDLVSQLGRQRFVRGPEPILQDIGHGE